MLDFLRGRHLRSRLNHPRDELWDRRLGVQTFGYVPAVREFSEPNWQGHYEPTPYGELFKMLRHVGVAGSDVFVDLGCGLGRAVFAAHHLGARAAIGVEIDASLFAGAQRNLAQARMRRSGLDFQHKGADAFEPAGCTVVFVYNAFGTGTLERVLDALKRDLARHPRDLRLVYFNPVHDSVVERAGFMARFDHWTKPEHLHPVSFWRATRPG